VFGLWKNGDISTPLMTVLKSGSLVSYSNRVVWLGNKTTASFRLHGVSISDDGFYGCKLDFEAFTVRDSVRLTVIASPRIKKSKSQELTQVKASEGQSVVIPCGVTGNPPPWISWTRDGEILQNSTQVSALTIKSVEEHMTGLYTCVAGNEAGTDRYDVLLLVTSCKHQSSGVAYRTQAEHHDALTFHAHTTLAPTLAVAFVLFAIFGAYFFFRYAGAKNKKSRNYNRMPQDEQARSLMGEWSSFTDNGEKI